MAKRIKILYTIPNFDTAGSGKVVYDLVKSIDKTRFEPHICCMHTKGAYFKTIESLGVAIHVFPFAVAYKPFYSLALRIWKIYRFFRTQRFDLIHSWHWSSDFTEPLAAKLAGVPFIYTKKAMGWGNKGWRWRSRLSTKIIMINSDMETQFFLGMRNKICSIPIGLDLNDFGCLKKTYKTANGYNIAQDDFVIVSIANLVPVKGIEFLLKAVQQLKHSKIKVFIVGDDTSDYAKHLKKDYKSSQIIFTGKQQDIKAYLALADVFVIPTLKKGEGQPIAPIEAMLSGRMVIGSNVSGIKDVLKDFPDNLFEAECVDALKEKLEYLMHLSEEERKFKSEQMRQFAISNYDLTLSLRLHESLYKSIIEK